jgi:hypothetical protein
MLLVAYIDLLMCTQNLAVMSPARSARMLFAHVSWQNPGALMSPQQHCRAGELTALHRRIERTRQHPRPRLSCLTCTSVMADPRLWSRG